MSDENPQEQLDEAKQDADEDLGEMDQKGDEMEERLAEHESGDEEVEVPEPGRGDDLSISAEGDKEAAGVGENGDGGAAEEAGVDEDAVPEDEGEAAAEAGQ